MRAKKLSEETTLAAASPTRERDKLSRRVRKDYSCRGSPAGDQVVARCRRINTGASRDTARSRELLKFRPATKAPKQHDFLPAKRSTISPSACKVHRTFPPVLLDQRSWLHFLQIHSRAVGKSPAELRLCVHLSRIPTQRRVRWFG